MGDRRPASPPSIQIHRYSQNCSSSRPVLRPSHNSSYASRSPFSAQGSVPMSIPNSRQDGGAPPPLPPPSFIPDLATGRDLGWEWGNRASKDRDVAEPLSPGTNIPPHWADSRSVDSRKQVEDLETRTREMSSATVEQQSFPEMFENDNDETYGSLQVSRSNFQSVLRLFLLHENHTCSHPSLPIRLCIDFASTFAFVVNLPHAIEPPDPFHCDGNQKQNSCMN